MTLPLRGERPPEARRHREPESSLDVYAVLGVTPDVTPALARDLYWVRVGRIQEEGVPDGEANQRIEELNEALGLILDDQRRARYDHTYVPAAPGPGRSASGTQPGRLHAGSVLALLLLTVVGASVAALQYGPLMIATVVMSGMLSMLLVIALPRRSAEVTAESAFSTLRLAPDAGMHEVNVAYEVIGEELLSRVRDDRRVLVRLERLDRAHSAALHAIALRAATDVRATGAARGRMLLFLSLAGRQSREFSRIILAALGALALSVMRVGSAALAVAGPRLWADATRLTGIGRTDREEDHEFASVSIDLSRRLASGRPPSVERTNEVVAGTSEDGQSAAVAALRLQLLNADIVLETDNGHRRVPIPATPLTIGSDPECNLVLPSTMGLAPEHAHVWQRDGTILIHVVTQRPAACLVNNEPMTWASLEDGDVILLGDARFSVRVN